MIGLRLDLLKADLNKVSPRYKTPISAIRNVNRKFFGNLQAIKEHFGDFSFFHDCHKLPLCAFKGFTVDELCKIKYSSVFCTDETVDKFFEKHYQHQVVAKIWSSMHQWGSAEEAWNDIVDAYECIRRFDFGDYADFEIRLDHSTYNNRKGFSKYSRTFIDGVFAFLVYYKKQHVMTIGYSVLKGKRILIQQVQLVKSQGNRFLYKLTSNRLEFVLDLFHRNFNEYQLYLVDGANLVENIMIEYRDGLANLVDSYSRHTKCLKTSKRRNKRLYRKWVKEDEEAMAVQKNRIRHLENDADRLQQFYSNTGGYALKKEECYKRNNLKHYLVTF